MFLMAYIYNTKRNALICRERYYTMKSITQETIAIEVGISRSWVNSLIKGRRNASFSLAKKLGARTGTNPVIWMEENCTAERQRAFLEVKLSARGKAA